MSDAIGHKAKDYVALIFDKKDRTPKAWAVMNFSTNMVKERTAVTFPYIVEFNLTGPPILSESGDRLRYGISFAHGHHPKPCSKAVFDFSNPNNYTLGGELPESLKHSIYVLLLLAQHGLDAGVNHRSNVRASGPSFLESEVFAKTPEFKVTKRTFLKWLTAWQWAIWEENSLSGTERFESMKLIAKHYDLDPWTNPVTFRGWEAAIRSGNV